MTDRIEIRDGKEYRVKVLPEAVPFRHRSQRTRYRLNEVGKQGGDRPASKRNTKAGYVPRADVTQPKTKYPFKATINGEEVIVWPDWIEREEIDPHTSL